MKGIESRTHLLMEKLMEGLYLRGREITYSETGGAKIGLSTEMKWFKGKDVLSWQRSCLE